MKQLKCPLCGYRAEPLFSSVVCTNIPALCPNGKGEEDEGQPPVGSWWRYSPYVGCVEHRVRVTGPAGPDSAAVEWEGHALVYPLWVFGTTYKREEDQ